MRLTNRTTVSNFSWRSCEAIIRRTCSFWLLILFFAPGIAYSQEENGPLTSLSRCAPVQSSFDYERIEAIVIRLQEQVDELSAHVAELRAREELSDVAESGWPWFVSISFYSLIGLLAIALWFFSVYLASRMINVRVADTLEDAINRLRHDIRRMDLQRVGNFNNRVEPGGADHGRSETVPPPKPEISPVSKHDAERQKRAFYDQLMREFGEAVVSPAKREAFFEQYDVWGAEVGTESATVALSDRPTESQFWALKRDEGFFLFPGNKIYTKGGSLAQDSGRRAQAELGWVFEIRFGDQFTVEKPAVFVGSDSGNLTLESLGVLQLPRAQ